MLSNIDYLLLIYPFMCLIIFLRRIHLSFQSHWMRILSAGLWMAWNREGLSWYVWLPPPPPPLHPFYLYRYILDALPYFLIYIDKQKNLKLDCVFFIVINSKYVVNNLVKDQKGIWRWSRFMSNTSYLYF